jgi:putative transcriptional regulator
LNAISSDKSFEMPPQSSEHFVLRAKRRAALSIHADIPRIVRELRERTGLTQEKFAARLGVTFPTVNRWENGRTRPSPLALRQIEDLLRELGDSGSDLLELLQV